KMDIPEDLIDLLEAPLPEMDIPEYPIQKDSSDDNSIVSLYEEFYSFISKCQSNKGKRPYVLVLENEEKYSFFPTSLNMARKAFGVYAYMIKYATCEQCCKIYNTADVSTDKPNMVPKGFEESCRKWAKRHNDAKRITDIYDRKIWKTFQDPNKDLPFFRKELSDSNLGLMINLNWFQQFDNSQYSVRAI
ncbi:7968_t:CDS:2, partial [Gigaspora rosea]